MTRSRSIPEPPAEVTAFAPATVANVAVGFDVLGFAFDAVGDRVTVRREPNEGLRVAAIEGVVTDLPRDPSRNTATVALRAMLDDLGLRGGFSVDLHKGLSLGSGMGGSAASAVGAVVAANALLSEPLEPARLLPYALAGEAAASGAPHADNAAPCLLGGLTAVVAKAPLRVVHLPVPEGLLCVLVHPRIRIDTAAARALLGADLPLQRHVEQTMFLTGFVTGCFRDDAALAAGSLVDLVAGPQRSHLIPAFDEARDAALRAGASCFAIAGSGPSVFAWATSTDRAREIERGVRAAFAARNVQTEAWIARPGGAAAHVIPGHAAGG